MAHYVFPVAANPGQPAAAYPTQTAYVATAPPTPYAATPRAGQYDGYQAAHPTPQYAYTTRPQVAVTPVSYDQTKAYYQPTQAAAYTAAETQHYQQGFELAYPLPGVLPAAAKPAYTSSSTYTTQRQTPKAPAVQVTTTGATYVYTATSTPAVPVTTYQPTYATNTTQASFSGYDAALYTAATSYYQQQTVKPAAGTWAMKKTGSQFKPKPKGPPKQPQLHYCDVCKISCAGPQTYREHLEGQKHKKKEQALKGGGNQPGGRGHNQLRCELCDVTCTGYDAYTAHIRGAKHQKVVKLHTKLGKPIPSSEPVVFNTGTSTATKVTTAATAAAATTSQTAKAPAVARPTIAATTQPGAKKIMATPKITFVGGTQLKTTGTKTEEVKVETMKADISPSSSEAKLSDSEEKLNILGEKDVNPVGHEYIDEVKNEQGKTISFNCKLCECKFNDPNAKEMHLKGRRHRLQYKKKVDPNLQVEVKPSIRARKVQEERLRRQAQKEEFFRRKEQEDRWREEMRMEDEMYWDQHRHRYEMMEYFEWQRHPVGPGMMPPRPFPPQMGPGGPMPFCTSRFRQPFRPQRALYSPMYRLHDYRQFGSPFGFPINKA